MKKITCFSFLRLALVGLVLTGAWSCIDEEPGLCVDPRGNVRLTVNLDTEITVTRTPGAPGATRADDPAYHINHLHVYVFDADERYVAFIEGGEYTGQTYEFFLNLPAGDYHFVAWTNPGDVYKTNFDPAEPESVTRAMSDMHFYLDHGGETLTEHLPDLLHGIARDMSVEENRDNHIDVAMASNNYMINMKLKGLPPTADEFEFAITDNNSHYTFDNTLIAGQDDFTHSRASFYYKGEATSSIKTLTLSEDRDPQFTVTRKNATGAIPDEVLFDQSLTQTIIDAYGGSNQSVDFAATHTYDIVLSFDVNMDLTVSVNGWEYTVSNTEL
jgi:hypothetical protein